MKFTYRAIKPLKEDVSAAYADICAHTNNIYAGDKLTSAHETTHQINSEIANSNGGRAKNVGLYLLNDVGFTVDEPSGFTIQTVASKVPQEFRGGICQVYDLYLVKQAASWGDRPMYLLDEWVAYTNGAVTALQLAQAGDGDTNRWSEIQNAIYFNMFCSVAYSIKPNTELLELCVYNLARVNQTFTAGNKIASLQRAETDTLLQKYYASEFYKPFADSHPDKLLDWGFEGYL